MEVLCYYISYHFPHPRYKHYFTLLIFINLRKTFFLLIICLCYQYLIFHFGALFFNFKFWKMRILSCFYSSKIVLL